jgi:hypothetical protein
MRGSSGDALLFVHNTVVEATIQAVAAAVD